MSGGVRLSECSGMTRSSAGVRKKKGAPLILETFCLAKYGDTDQYRIYTQGLELFGGVFHMGKHVKDKEGLVVSFFEQTIMVDERMRGKVEEGPKMVSHSWPLFHTSSISIHASIHATRDIY